MLKSVLSLSLILGLTACAGVDGYQPTLLSTPKNASKYEIDLQECKTDAKARVQTAINENRGRGVAIGMFGLVGGVVDKAAVKDDYNTSPLDMIDECLRGRGYEIPKTSRL